MSATPLGLTLDHIRPEATTAIEALAARGGAGDRRAAMAWIAWNKLFDDIVAGGVTCTKCGDPITRTSLGWCSVLFNPENNGAITMPFCHDHLGGNSRIERLAREAIAEAV